MQLEMLKRRLGTDDDKGDELFIDLLCEAEAFILAYTGRSDMPGVLRGIVIDLAAMHYQRLGMQGEISHSEGSVSITMESLPQNIKALLDRYRVAKVVK